MLKIIIEENVKYYIGNGNYKVRAYIENETDTVYFATQFNLLVYLHEYVHFLFFKLPDGLAHILNLIWDLLDTFTSTNCYHDGIIKVLKGTWREYRFDKQGIEENFEPVFREECEEND